MAGRGGQTRRGTTAGENGGAVAFGGPAGGRPAGSSTCVEREGVAGAAWVLPRGSEGGHSAGGLGAVEGLDGALILQNNRRHKGRT